MGAMLTRVLSVSLGVSGPDSLPGSRQMMLLCLVSWVAISTCGYVLLFPGAPLLVAVVLVFELLLLFAFSRFVLVIYGKPERWPQTLVSLLAVQALINALQLPLIYFGMPREEPGIVVEAAGFGLLAWWLLAAGRILAKAADRPVWVGLALAVAHFFFSLLMYVSLLQLFGVAPGTS